VNVFWQWRLNEELNAEMAAHMEEAIEQGHDPEEVRRAFSSTLLNREQNRIPVSPCEPSNRDPG